MEKDLDKLLSNLEVTLNEGSYVFVSTSQRQNFDENEIVMQFRENEGFTYIISSTYAQIQKLNYSFIASWITLNVQSALDAVGLTATVSKALADQNISANIVAAFYHDHIFVANKDANKAVNVLSKLTNQ